MLIRTLAPLIVAGVFKYVTSRILMHQFALMCEKSLREREQNNHNAETPQSEN